MFNVFVEELGLNYRFHENRAVLEFEDGTEYTMKEALILSRARVRGRDLRVCHEVKKIFDGVFVTENDLELLPWKDHDANPWNAGNSKRSAFAAPGEKPEKSASKGIKAKRKTSAHIEKHIDAVQTRFL